ncbi:CDP-alcohol phosphatidyltransferase family protein [uncultured Anaerotruncus sp.]|uniref:CDP-alcohol phosphatidyltransferase family protein n=1 Tax=uncultured Anaerotruncus sp. TaxID=905011 RepID=UPI00280C2645|nr:CDP-alcohol phosphatidyltransferase family protein [uncultured Anaerotruncus sp.]
MKMNVPNALTVLRILLIPLFLWRFLTAQTQPQFYAAALVLGVSALSDTLDGYIARHYDQITQLGKILDPIADKLTLASVVAALWITKPHLWPLYAVFILKEFLMLVGGLRLHRKQVTIEGAKWFGKLATVMFYVIMITIVAFPALGDGTIFAMLLLLLVFMLFSLLRYGVMFWGMLRSAKKR